MALYDLASLPIGVIGCAGMFFGLVYTVALSFVGIGVVLSVFVARAARAGGRFERDRARRYLGIEIAEPGDPPPTEGTMIARLLAPIRDVRTRREVGYFLLVGPVGVGSALVAGGTLYFIGRAIVELLFIPFWPDALHGAWGGSALGALFVHCAPGVIALVAGPTVIERTAYAQGRLIRRRLSA
ncbi:MAG: sensor domain-containing protein [Solirubrobacteraceae bacterium]